MRLAQLDGQVTVHELAVRGLAREFHTPNSELYRRIAAVKVGAGRLGELVMSECLQLFGGCGYLESETPIGELWRDIRLVRLAAGTDEIMWELIAGGLVPDDDSYDRLVRTDP
jgi:alkylation response protein AidB-like acyl-CoA dehydrogenase